MPRVCVWRWCYWACADLQILGDPARDHPELRVCSGACSGVSSSCLQAFSVCTEPPLYGAMYYGRCDLFNMLVHSIASYAYEVWVDSKKIEAIEVTYRRFLKSLLVVRKTTNTSIVLANFGKFPFEHFAWGQAMLYYNHVSMVTKDCILGKAWEA